MLETTLQASECNLILLDMFWVILVCVFFFVGTKIWHDCILIFFLDPKQKIIINFWNFLFKMVTVFSHSIVILEIFCSLCFSELMLFHWFTYILQKKSKNQERNVKLFHFFFLKVLISYFVLVENGEVAKTQYPKPHKFWSDWLFLFWFRKTYLKKLFLSHQVNVSVQ